MSQKILESGNYARTPNHNPQYENNFRGRMSRKISELEKLPSYSQLEFAIKYHEKSVNRKMSRKILKSKECAHTSTPILLSGLIRKINKVDPFFKNMENHNYSFFVLSCEDRCITTKVEIFFSNINKERESALAI